MDPFETRLKSLPLREPSEAFGQPQTLTAILENAQRPKSSALQRIYQLPWKSKVAAALVVAVGAFAAYAVLSTSTGSSIALAQVVEKLASAHSLSFEMEVQPDGGGGVTKGHLIFAEPNKMRGDVKDPNGNEAILISDLAAGKTLLLSPKLRIGFTASVKASDQDALKENMVDGFRSLAKKGYRSLGKKQLDGVEAEEFELDKEGIKIRLWADARTANPVRMEMDNYPLPPPYGPSKVVANNFKIDEKLEPSLFSVESPPGYVILPSPVEIDITAKPTDLAVTVLRKYAKLTGGDFPEQLNDEGKSIRKELEKHRTAKGDQAATKGIDLEFGAFMTVVVQLNSYFAEHKQGVDFQYYPGGKLGEKDRLVFWCKDDKTGQYTTVFGDLRVEKIGKEKLPSPPENDGKK